MMQGISGADLPERQEQDGLDAKELGHRVVLLQGRVEHDVEETEAIERVAH